MSDKPIRRTTVEPIYKGRNCVGKIRFLEILDDDPDFDELIEAAQDVVETGTQSSDGRHCIVSEDLIDRLRKALEPRSNQ